MRIAPGARIGFLGRTDAYAEFDCQAGGKGVFLF